MGVGRKHRTNIADRLGLAGQFSMAEALATIGVSCFWSKPNVF